MTTKTSENNERIGDKIGYTRVSTNKQNHDLQLDALKKDGCIKIYSDTISGSKSDRPELKRMLENFRQNDCVVVYKLDRLGRSLRDLIKLMNQFKDKGIKFKSINDNIDTETPQGKLLFHIMGAIAEFERDMIRERVYSGLKSARARGRVGGRKTKVTDKLITKANKLYKNNDLSTKDILKILKVKRSVFYRMTKCNTIEDYRKITNKYRKKANK